VIADECELDDVEFDEDMLARLIRLHVSSNSLCSVPSFSTSCFIRWLDLSQNTLNIAGWSASLSNMPCLIHLNLSFNDGLSFEEEDVSPICGTLQHLIIEGCGLTSLDGIKGFTKLTDLSVAENEDLSIDGITDGCAGMSVLEKLDVSHCGAESEARFQQAIMAKLSCITWLTSNQYGIYKNPAKEGGAVAKAAGAKLDNSDLMDANSDSSSCSCIEGNPCLVPDNCLDWKNRNEIATAVRLKKGHGTGTHAR
jgi:hypothetical protein